MDKVELRARKNITSHLLGDLKPRIVTDAADLYGLSVSIRRIREYPWFRSGKLNFYTP
jgi:hypothetical protein